MISQTAIPSPARLTDQPTNWPLFYILLQTSYVRRQRAANSPQHNPRPKAEVSDYSATRKKVSYLQRGINRFAAARERAWFSLKRLGREVARQLVKWCLLLLATGTRAATCGVLCQGYYLAHAQASMLTKGP
jgi:hypothetical protein